MRRRLLLVPLVLSAMAASYDAATPYFARARAVTVPGNASQSYITLDSDVWKYARPDLSDIRLYDGESQVPYALVKQSGGSSTEETPAKVLNLGSVAGHTEFDLDVSSLAEYDRVRLQLDAKNFISNAQVQGRRTLKDSSATNLGSSTLYDFTDEGLGSNSTLKFPTASFPYLHVRLAPGIRPDRVNAAYLSNFAETKANWATAGQCVQATGSPKESTFDCTLNDGTPVERISFRVSGSGERNFSRAVTVSDDNGSEIQTGEISRVQVKRGGQTVSNENLTIDLYPRVLKNVRVVVENGDDAPLPIAQVQPLCFERRIYFDPRGHPVLRLYYGDPKLNVPSYDYAKFFQQNPDAVAAQLSAGAANTQFTGRPDDRPWSERHNWVLWAAMLLAVAVLGGLTIRGLKAETKTES